jgi:endo-1,4-beta-xylanase
MCMRKVILPALVAGCMTMAAQAQTVNNNGQGTNSGFFYSLFTSSGSATMTFPNAGQFPGNYAITWSGVGDVVGGKGWQTGSNRTVNYNVGAARGFNTISVYGWTTNPLVEYYINELGSLFTANATRKGTVNADGHTYTTFEHLQVNQPSIVGTATFQQYLDAWGGSTMGANHSVTTGTHFSHWQSLGMPLGAFNYQILATEAFNGASGSVNATVW